MRKCILFLTFILGAVQLQAQGCVPDITLTTYETTTPVLHQASNTVVGSSGYGVSPGYDSTLRAGVLVELKDDVYIKSGALFLAHIAPCGKPKARQQGLSDKSAAVSALMAYPNPVESTLNLSVDHAELSKITLATLDGKVIATHEAKNETSLQLELGNYSSGIYLITVETADGQVFRDKIVKN